VLANQDGEGMHDLAKFARKNNINMGITEPDEQEAKEMAAAQQAAANQPPDAQTQYFEAEAAKALAGAEKAKADTQKVLAEVDETRADTAKTLFEMQKEQQQTQQTMQEMMVILQAMQQSQLANEQQIKQEVTPPPEQLMPDMGQMEQMMEGAPDDLPPMEGVM